MRKKHKKTYISCAFLGTFVCAVGCEIVLPSCDDRRSALRFSGLWQSE